MKPTHNLPDGEWLVSGGLIYRLRDGVNCDEINVAMVDGSRDTDHRHGKANALLALLATTVQPVVEAASERVKQLEHIVLVQSSEFAKIHEALGLPKSDTMDAEVMVRSIRQMRSAFHVNMLRAFPQMSHDEISAAIAKACGAVPPEGQEAPVAWARKWFADGEEPKKERNSNGRWAWPFKFKLLPLTPNKIQKDDVPLFSRLSLPVEAGEVTDADALANFIRQIDGSNTMGAGALAEKICDWHKSGEGRA